MSLYDDRLSAALIPQKTAEVERRLDDMSINNASRADDEVEGGRERLASVLEHATTVTGTADPELISSQQITDVAGSLDRLGEMVSSFESGEFPWTEVDGVLDGLLDHLSRWPHAGGIPPSEVKEAASRFRRSAGQQLAGLEAEIQGLRHQVTGQHEITTDSQARSEEALASATAQVEALKAAIEEQKGRLEEAIRTNQGQFSEAQERRVGEFRDQLTEFEGRIAAFETGSKELLKESEARLDEDISDANKKMQDQLEEAERIVGVIATTGTVGGFQREAGSQKQTADWLRVGALLAGLAAAGLAIWGVVHAAGHSGDSADIAAKALASFVFFGIAGYLATQSGKHRDREERARRRELELAAFGPFINDLPEEKQDALVEKLAERIFGHEPPSQEGGNGITEENVSMFGQIAAILRSAGQ
jgi:hypothetical protein